MNNLSNYFHLLLLSMSGMLLLCIIFAINMELADGVLMGRICWFHFAALLFAVSILFMEFTVKKSRFIFSLPDGLLLSLFGLVLLTYDQTANIQPEKIMFLIQFVALWFMLRTALLTHKELRLFFITIIIFIGVVIALWDIWNQYNIPSSTHPVFKLFQKAISLEPLTGYMAITLPVCLNIVLRFQNCTKQTWWETRTFLFYLSAIGTVTLSTALFMEANRSACVASIISCLWICSMRLICWKKTKEIIKQHKKKFALFSITLFVAIAGISMLGSISKANAGDQRLLIWNVTTKAIMEHPISGTGLGGFPTTFAHTQAAYLASGTASEKEKENAICPDYAYNEYLQIGLEFGIIGLLLFALWLGFSLYYGIKHRQISASGGIVSLAIFALYSYPLHVPTFWILLIFFTAICTTNPKQNTKQKQRNIPYIGALAALVTCIIFYEQRNCNSTYKEWNTAKELYKNKVYDTAAVKYNGLYVPLSHRADFLLEGADCLSKTGKHELAISWLKRALQISANPDIYYAMAQNKEALGQYEDAEAYLLNAIHLLPKRGHAYFLLVRLYTQPSFFHPEKLQLAANTLLQLPPIKQSMITPEIKKEVRLILNERGFGSE